MRILHVIDDLQLGGAERNLVSVIPALPHDQHHVVHLLDDDAYAQTLRNAGIRVEHVPARRFGQYASALARLRRLCTQFDVIHTQRWLSDLLGRLAAYGRLPIVTTVQTSPYEQAAMAGYGLLGRCQAHAIRLTDILLSSRAAERVVAVSDYVRQLVVRRLRVPPQRTRVVYNAVPVAHFKRPDPPERATIRRELGLQVDDATIVTVGHVVAHKGQHLLIEALPELLRRAPSALLLVVGDGSDRRRLERRAVELGVGHRVRWLGVRSDVPRILGAADVFALASSYEGLPLSAVEAMAASLPCVLSPIPPHFELRARVRAIDGYLADCMIATTGTSAAWATALAVMARNTVQREALGQRGHAAAQRHFDVQVTAPALAQVFSEAIDAFARRLRS